MYASRIEDLPAECVIWHRVPIPPGPEVIRYPGWLLANATVRSWDRLRGLRPDVLYSPGANCLRPDVVSVHALFPKIRQSADLVARNDIRGSLSLARRVHRWLYYRLAERMERAVYRRKGLRLIAVSKRTESELRKLFGDDLKTAVSYHGVDAKLFSPGTRQELRDAARHELGLQSDSIAVLLIGNDWAAKGLATLVEAVRSIGNDRICILAVGDELVRRFNLGHPGTSSVDVRALPKRSDVEFYYSAADIYASPSLEDSFALPVLEAMACGLPVITSSAAGVSEVIHRGEDGIVLDDPRDISELARHLQHLAADSAARRRFGENAARTASQFTWEQNARELRSVLIQVLDH
ncbi:MAG TPA: glycosyltransferase family 4 protein, partial [Candidatus Acidoferrales bacterium]|nr:glycosyltransferase family 4 protein [Candidatus Acidoferrales bacterium]